MTRLFSLCFLAVVLINQITTKIGEGPGSSSFLAPALGETWAHACTNRAMLYWQDGQRFARLYKSPSLPFNTASYVVTQDGVSVLTAGSLGGCDARMPNDVDVSIVYDLMPSVCVPFPFQIRGVSKKRSRRGSQATQQLTQGRAA
jgi:hypothetical protein